ncbi:methyl-accepting chemotaxis protein [Giesbergeria sinuosa]|uniref:Methyl-accepting chemotaxis protein n=1 Tax=Giesbergeria sinuosa TaxID=80883 RepID=A0ABV9QB19_9BURK
MDEAAAAAPGISGLRKGRFGTGFQLALAFAFALIVMCGFVAGAWLQQKAVDATLQEFGDVEVDRIRRVDRWIAVSEDASLRYMVIHKSNDASLQQLLEPTAQARSKMADEMAAAVAADASTQEEKAWLANFTKVRGALRKATEDTQYYKQLGDVAGASALFDTEFLPAQQIYSQELQRYGDIQRQRLESKLQEVVAAGQRKARLAVVAAMLFAFMTALFAWYVVRHIQRSLRRAVQSAQWVAEGDLSHPVMVTGRDEFAVLMHSMAAMNLGLARIVGEVRLGTDGIALAAHEIAQGNNDLSHRTEQQASSLQQTTAAMLQLTSSVHHNATTAQQADACVRQATEVATQGGVVMTQVVNTMNAIDQAARKIEEIVGVIDTIAFQTNILALNAAVEAARAGEQGRGFAVVAQEVRDLAKGSATAAKEIKALIADSTAKVREGNGQVQAAGVAMQSTVTAIQSVSQFMSVIRAATTEQATDIGHVNTCVAQLDALTQQNAALVEQAAAAAQALHQQAQRLETAVASFQLTAA